MKKIISVVLCAVMLLCAVPFSAGAVTNVTLSTGEYFDNDLAADTAYTVDVGAILTVPANKTLWLPHGTSLYVPNGAKLNVIGSLVTLSDSSIKIDGDVNGAARITGEGEVLAQVRFPALADVALTNKITVAYAFSTSGNTYDDLAGNLTFTRVSDAGDHIYMPLNSYVYLKAIIREPDAAFDKFDDSLFDVFFNNVGIPFVQGSHNFTLSTAGDVSYEHWTNENDYLNTFKISLPKGDGYDVYGRNGEQTASGQVVYLKYGQSFSFRVDIDQDYDQSPYEVYIYDGYGWLGIETDYPLIGDVGPAVPDEYGYYNIPEIKGDCSVYVMGVVENKTINMIGNIIEMIRNIFTMVKSFFDQILAMFR